MIIVLSSNTCAIRQSKRSLRVADNTAIFAVFLLCELTSFHFHIIKREVGIATSKAFKRALNNRCCRRKSTVLDCHGRISITSGGICPSVIFSCSRITNTQSLWSINTSAVLNSKRFVKGKSMTVKINRYFRSVSADS